MTKNEMVAYMRNELKEVEKELEVAKIFYHEATEMEGMRATRRLEKVEAKSLYLWMLCNKMGIFE